MRRTTFEDVPCPIARTMDALGDWWVPLILREALYGARRFSEFQRMLGISSNILSDRLARMTAQGLLEREAQSESGGRAEYVLTDCGRDAISVLAAMMAWADRWAFGGVAPIHLRDRKTGRRIVPRVIDQTTGKPFDARRVTIVPGPGFPDRPAARAFRFPELEAER